MLNLLKKPWHTYQDPTTAVAATVGGNLLGSLIQGDAARSAANTQADAARAAAAQQAAMMKPYTDAASTLMPQITSAVQGIKPFSLADAAMTPAEQVAQQRAAQAVTSSNAARSGLLNTNALDQAQTNAAQIGSTFENQAFNQYWANQQNQLQPMMAAAGLATGPMQQVADTSANALLAAGGAQAGGQVGAANALAGGLSSAGNTPMQMWYMNQIFGGGGGGATGGFSPVTPYLPSVNAPGGSYGSGFGSGAGYGNQDLGSYLMGGGP